MIVYKITNTVNGKVYIGQTIRPLASRIKAHRNGHSSDGSRRLQRAKIKYGWKAFEVTVLEQLPSGVPISYLNHLEELHIALHDSTNPEKGYNIESGGKNAPASQETRELLSKQRKGIPTGRVMTQEEKDHLSRLRKGVKRSEEDKRKMREGSVGKNTGRVLSEETKKKLSEALTGREFSEEHKKKLSLAKTGSKHSEEGLANCRAAAAKLHKTVTLVSPDGEKVEVTGIKPFCREKGIAQPNLVNVINGKALSAKGWRLYTGEDSLVPFNMSNSRKRSEECKQKISERKKKLL